MEEEAKEFYKATLIAKKAFEEFTTAYNNLPNEIKMVLILGETVKYEEPKKTWEVKLKELADKRGIKI